MKYNRLSAEDLRQLRMERLTALEADHFRLVLCLEEAPDDVGILAKLSGLEDRIAVHVGAFNGEHAEPKDPLVPVAVDG